VTGSSPLRMREDFSSHGKDYWVVTFCPFGNSGQCGITSSGSS
jgi:hypothetical protein